MKKALIVGCGGMLGRDVHEVFSKNYKVLAVDIDVNEDWLKYGDCGDFQQMKNYIDIFRPDIILNLAAETDLEWCERNVNDTYKTNAYGSELLGYLANERDITYVYVSTAGVVDGHMDVYNEFNTANPLSVYAIAKHYGELYTLRSVKKHYIFRAGWMMGGGRKDKKFISKIYKQVLSGSTKLYVVDDKLGTPTYTKDFAENMLNVIENNIPYGLYNSVCGGDASRYDVAVEMFKILNLDIEVEKVDSNYFKEDYFAPRPYSEKLVNFKLDVLGHNKMRHWKICLSDYLLKGTFNEITL